MNYVDSNVKGPGYETYQHRIGRTGRFGKKVGRRR